jgi:CYTH domain-containing protein
LKSHLKSPILKKFVKKKKKYKQNNEKSEKAKMNRTFRTELRRLFLFQTLPAPLTAASSHLQIFDNYIENTRLRIRSARSPETKQWTFVLQQIIVVADDLSRSEISEIYLNDAEHQVFEQFEGREIKRNERAATNEIRKNRYFYDFHGKQIELDVFLGDLWGVNLARVTFENETELKDFTAPPFAVLEATNNPFFAGANLVGKKLADVRAELNESV